MKNKLAGSLLCLLLASALGRAEGPKHHAKQSRIDPCSLLTSADVAAVQGEPVEQTKPSDQPGTGLLILQCLFRTTTPTKSVSLTVAAPSAMSPRAFWRKQFHPGQDSEKKKILPGQKRNLWQNAKNKKKRKARARAPSPGWKKRPIGSAGQLLARSTS